MCEKSFWGETRLVCCRQPWLGRDLKKKNSCSFSSPDNSTAWPCRVRFYSVTATSSLHPCGLSPLDLPLACLGIRLEEWKWWGLRVDFRKGTEGEWSGSKTRCWWSRERKQKGSVVGLEVRVEFIKGYITQTDSQQYVQELKQYGNSNNSNFKLK